MTTSPRKPAATIEVQVELKPLQLTLCIALDIFFGIKHLDCYLALLKHRSTIS